MILSSTFSKANIIEQVKEMIQYPQNDLIVQSSSSSSNYIEQQPWHCVRCVKVVGITEMNEICSFLLYITTRQTYKWTILIQYGYCFNIRICRTIGATNSAGIGGREASEGKNHLSLALKTEDAFITHQP